MQKYYSGDGLFFVMPQQQSCTESPNLAASAGRWETGLDQFLPMTTLAVCGVGVCSVRATHGVRLTLTLRAYFAAVPARRIGAKFCCFGFSVHDSLGVSRLDRAMSRDFSCELDILFVHKIKS